MTELERIWVEVGYIFHEPRHNSTEYVRADLLATTQRDLEKVEDERDHWIADNRRTLKAGQDVLDNLETTQRELAKARAERDAWYQENLDLQRQIVGQAEHTAERNYLRGRIEALVALLEQCRIVVGSKFPKLSTRIDAALTPDTAEQRHDG